MRYAALLAALALLPAVAAATTITPEDSYKVVGYSSPRISPDGKRLLFTRSHVNLETDGRDIELVVMDIASGDLRVLTQNRTSVSSPEWSPRGDKISFVSPADDKTHQVWVLPTNGGEAEQATAAPRGVDEYSWRPDEGAIAYLTSDPPAKKTGLARFQDSYRVSDNAFLAVGPFRNAHLWLASVRVVDGSDRWTATGLTSGPWNVAGATLSWSLNGAELAYVRTPTSIPADGGQSTVQILNLATGKSRALTGHTHNEWNPRFSPVDGSIAYAASYDGNPNNRSDVYLTDGHGPGRDVSASIDRNAGNYTWYPDGRGFLLQAPDGTHTSLWHVDLDGHVTKVDTGDVSAVGDFDGSIARDGGIAFVGSTSQQLGEVYYLAPGSTSPKQLTRGNAWLADRTIGHVRSIAWDASSFHEDGVVTYPPDYVAGKKYPLVLDIHGGPTEASSTGVDLFAQSIAAHGYVVFEPNYRGSDNLGNAYQYAVYRDPVVGPDKDIMAGVAAVEAQDHIDRSRVCVSGWSYGGLMTSWLITHHDWRCAISGAAVDDQLLDTVLADDIDDNEYAMFGAPFANAKNLQDYRDASPITYYRNVHTPTLILDDTYDIRVPEPESYAFFHALQDSGKVVEFYQWPITAHFPGDPIRRADVYNKWIAWLDKYLR